MMKTKTNKFNNTMTMTTATANMTGGGEPCLTLHNPIAEPVGSDKMTGMRTKMKMTTITMTRRVRRRRRGMVRKRRGKRRGGGEALLGRSIILIISRGIGTRRRRIVGRGRIEIGIRRIRRVWRRRNRKWIPPRILLPLWILLVVSWVC